MCSNRGIRFARHFTDNWHELLLVALVVWVHATDKYKSIVWSLTKGAKQALVVMGLLP